MKLNLPERISLMGMLPNESDYATLRMAWIMRQNLGFTSDEIKEFDIKSEASTSRITWNDKGGAYVRDIPFDDAQTTLIKQILIDLNAKKQLHTQDFSLYEKFIVEYRAG